MNGKTDVDPESPGNNILELTGGTPPGDNEEKGNGGPPLEGDIRNISSFKEFFDTLEKSLTEKSFQDFIAAYYKNAQKNFS